MRLAGQHAIVTGGGTGIGAAIARRWRRKARSSPWSAARREPLEEVAPAVRTRWSRRRRHRPRRRSMPPSPIARDGARPDLDPRQQCRRRAGAPFAKVTEELWREMLAVNLDGMFHCCQAALADLLAAEAGRIVTIASMAACTASPTPRPISPPSTARSA